MNTQELIRQTFFQAGEAGVRLHDWEAFMDRLTELHEHNSAHFDHSLRVGLYSYRVAYYLGYIDAKFALYAGCGHDIGKCDICNDVLDAKDFGPAEMEQVKAHAELGYEKLKDTNLFTALVAGLHHKFQPEGYGIDLDDIGSLTEAMKAKVERMAKLVMLCDFFDAMTTRQPQKFPGEVIDVMYRFFPDKRHITNLLVRHQLA